MARRFYLDDRTKMQIATELGMSRFRVARLLALAHSAGIVTITVADAGDVDGELSLDVEERFKLRNAVVLSTPQNAEDDMLRHLLGGAAADLLTYSVSSNDVLGLGWARSVLAMVANLSKLAPCPVVQLSGALTRPDVESDSIELVRTVARIGGGAPAFFYAPMITANPGGARALQAQADVAAGRAVRRPQPRCLRGPVRSPDRQTRPPGTHCPQRPHHRHLRRPVGATHAAIRGGYINTLVTNAPFARALLHHHDPS